MAFRESGRSFPPIRFFFSSLGVPQRALSQYWRNTWGFSRWPFRDHRGHALTESLGEGEINDVARATTIGFELLLGPKGLACLVTVVRKSTTVPFPELVPASRRQGVVLI